MLYEAESSIDVKSFWNSIKAANISMPNQMIIIGPEGGFTHHEVAMAKKSGIITLSLGTQILRVETAALAAISIWQYEMGSMSL